VAVVAVARVLVVQAAQAVVEREKPTPVDQPQELLTLEAEVEVITIP
jgi:hypothetical protein